jgi:hypothetical protein
LSKGIHYFFAIVLMITIRTHTDNGPYFPPTAMTYQANCLRDVLFHVRMEMDDGEDIIGAFNEHNVCYGMWENKAEPTYENETGWTMPGPTYVLKRAGGRSAKTFAMAAAQLQRAA